jgi:hypothetical protein
MKRKCHIFVVLVILCFALLFSACGNKTNNGTQTPGLQTDEKTTSQPSKQPTSTPASTATSSPSSSQDTTKTPEETATPVPPGSKATLKDVDGFSFSMESETRYFLDQVSGNNHVISGTYVEAFTMGADITIFDGDRASLVFGALNNDYLDYGTLYGIEIRRESGSLFIKMFQDASPGYTALGDGIIPDGTLAASDVDTEEPIKFFIEVTQDKEVKVSVNGEPVDFIFDTERGFEEDYQGGYLGLLTWNSSAEFDNLYYTDKGKFK